MAQWRVGTVRLPAEFNGGSQWRCLYPDRHGCTDLGDRRRGRWDDRRQQLLRGSAGAVCRWNDGCAVAERRSVWSKTSFRLRIDGSRGDRRLERSPTGRIRGLDPPTDQRHGCFAYRHPGPPHGRRGRGTGNPVGPAAEGQEQGAAVRSGDVPEGHVFEYEAHWLAANDITRGCNPPDNDGFCPEHPVTRGQMAAFLVRALHLPVGSKVFV